MKDGKDGWTPRVFGGFTGRWNNPSAIGATMTADAARTTDGRVQPASANSTPTAFRPKAASSAASRVGLNPRKTGSHRALNPQTNGTRKPQVSRGRNRWSRAAGNAGESPA